MTTQILIGEEEEEGEEEERVKEEEEEPNGVGQMFAPPPEEQRKKQEAEQRLFAEGVPAKLSVGLGKRTAAHQIEINEFGFDPAGPFGNMFEAFEDGSLDERL